MGDLVNRKSQKWLKLDIHIWSTEKSPDWDHQSQVGKYDHYEIIMACQMS